MTKLPLHIVDYLIIIVSIVAPILISIKFSRKQNSANKFFTAGGTIPSWAIGISILATLISSVTFLAYPGEGFSSNWILLVQGLMVPITLIFFVRFVVPLYRKHIRISAYEYFERRFGFLARLYSSLGFFLAHFSKMGTVFFLISLALSKMIGISTSNTIWIIGGVVILITLLGGIEAVVWMDVMQGIMLIIGGIVALLIIVFNIDGGFSTIWQIGTESGRIGFGPYDFDFVKLTFWVMVFNGIFYAIQKYGTDQTMVQRYLTAKSDKGAIKASLMGVLMSVPVWAMFMFIGTALYAYYTVHAGELPEGIKPDAVFPHFIMHKMPVGVVGIVLAALIAAAISSLDSDLNCLSAITLEDYYKRFKPKCSEKEQMIVSRAVIAIAGLAALIIAQYYVGTNGKGVLSIVFTLYSIFSGGIAGMFLLGIFSKRANKQGLYFGMLASILFTGYAVLTSTFVGEGESKRLILNLGSYNFSHHKMMLGVYSHVVLFAVAWVASFFFKSKKETFELTYYGWKNHRDSEINKK
jgi:solute:Na+ symporter, SSS family